MYRFLVSQLRSQHKMLAYLSYMGFSLSFTVSTLKDRMWKITCLKKLSQSNFVVSSNKNRIFVSSHLLAYNGFSLSFVSSLNPSFVDVSRHSLWKQTSYETRRVHSSLYHGTSNESLVVARYSDIHCLQTSP